MLAGCETVRFAPGQNQKQNAWLHNRTAIITAQTAQKENSSQQLQQLTKLSELQSKAFVADYGLPEEFPTAENAEDILSQSNFNLAYSAIQDSTHQPDGWKVADNALELGIGLSALFGGVYGTKALWFLKLARTKSKALQQIITGNELFKKENTEYISAFKQAHNNQSPATRQIVAQMKI